MNPTPRPPGPNGLLAELRELIEQARSHVARAANATLTMLYWHVGQRIHKEVLRQGRAGYGEEIVSTLSTQLVAEYGKGFSPSALTRMVKFAELFPDEAIVATLSQQLSWSHFIELLPLKQALEREYCAEISDLRAGDVPVRRISGASALAATGARCAPRSG